MKITIDTDKLKTLSINQLLVCEIINDYSIKDYDLISKIINKKKDTVYRYVRNLEDEGYIDSDTVNFTECDRFIYLALNIKTGNVKIGVSVNPENRIKMLSYRIKQPLVLLNYKKGGYRKEKELHHKFKELNIKDEWFNNNQDILNEFDVNMFYYE